ncbi:hypothetical protein FALBO_8410 [Fusarium albosuccineum]|uniref:C2H2-type domain-containing protein n=1 Tax=Fusarium albosuccineum TaxID=1237068 RepID=A0A8H4L9N9_9HYPO|nr:hypothetical protein FALBO_8410 [Fusarium albosuccineum]
MLLPVWDSDSECTEESCCEDDDDVNGDFALPKEHPFQKARRPLLRHARQGVKAFAATATAQYGAPPDHQPRPWKRPRSSKWTQESTFVRSELGDDGDQEDTDDGFLMVPSLKETFRFSCPFYKQDPKKYRQCLLQHDLRTFDSVIKHVQRHHKKPSYCPMCSQTFKAVIDCDRHILKRSCEKGDLIIPEGVNSNERAVLGKRDRRRLSNIERWGRVNDTIFPGAESVPSPYLDQGCGREISIARDYWEKYGWRSVFDFLTSRGMLNGAYDDDDDERAGVMLYKSTLVDLLAEIMEEYEHLENQ